MLAFACAFTMFAGAAFTDEADIQAKDAVNMLTALGVIEGYEDNSFQPDGVVTRAEMAKMIFVVRNNTIDDAAYENVTSNLTDITNHWAKGYIKFCESQGIIAGKGNGIFDPDAPVTGVEAAKMLLVLTGYSADKAGLTGANWETNTLRYAGSAGILDGVVSSLSSGLPRQYAAQIIYNTLDAWRVQWSTDSESFDYFLNGGVKETVGRAYMKLCADYGTLTEITNDSLTIKVDGSYDSENYHKSNEDPVVGFTKVATDYSSLLGQKVKVMFKDGKTNDVLGVYSISDNTVYNTLMNKVELDGSKVKFDGTSYSVDGRTIDTTYVGVDGVDADKSVAQPLSFFDSTADSNTGKTSLDEVTFVDSDGNGKIDTAIVIEKQAGEVTHVGSDKITIDGKSYNFSDENIADDLAKDDWAVISADLYNDCKNIVKADTLVTTADSYKDKTDYHQYELDGTWYNISDKNYNDAGIATGDTVTAYVVNGVIVKMKADDGTGGFPTNIAVVVGVGGGTNSLDGDQARIRFFDGTIKTVTISDRSKTPVQGTAYKVSGSDTAMRFDPLDIYDGSTVTTKYNGFEYNGVGDAQPSDDQIANINDNGTTKVDDNAAIILYTADGRSKQITGKQFNALNTNDLDGGSNSSSGIENGYSLTDNATAVFTKETNGLNRVRMAAVLVKSISISGTSNDVYGYIVDDARESNGDVVYSLWTSDNQYIENVVEQNSYNAGDRAKGTVIGFSSIDSDNVIHDVDVIGNVFDKNLTELTGTPSANTTYVGGNQSEATDFISVDGQKIDVTGDTKVLFVDSEESDENAGIEFTYGTDEMIAAQYDDVNRKYVRNVFFTTSTDNSELELLVLDTTGAFDGFEPADTDEPEVEKGDYSTAFAEVSVYDKSVIKGAASDRNASTNDVTVEMTVADYITAVDYNKIIVTKNGVSQTKSNTAFSGNTITFTVAGVAADESLAINVAGGLVTRVAASGDTTAKTFANFKGITFAAAPAITSAKTGTAVSDANVIVNAESANGNDNYNMNGKTLNVTVTLTGATFDSNDATTAVIQISGIDNSSAADNDNNATSIPAFTANGDSAVTLTVTSVVEA